MMRLTNALSYFALAAALLGASSSAQTRFCIGGDLDHLTVAQRASCSAKMQTVHTIAAAMHAPDNWHFVVVCGEEGWQNYANYTMAEAETLTNAVADTNLEQHETFFRESRLDAADLRSMRKAVAHEIAGILLHSKDEVAINTQAAHLLASTGDQAGI